MVAGEPLRAGDPTAISSYRLLRRLGEGGMGVVYLAEDPHGRHVAVKVIREPLAADGEFRARFRAEVANASKVARFCTAPILASDTDGHPPYVVTEFIDGPTLAAVVDEHGPLSGSQLHALGVGIANALGVIHRAGVIHRDLKPGNVLLSRFGPQVIDFGIARAVDATSGITQTGAQIGSPSFMAPEQFKGEAVTPKADIFAWGAVMAFAGTGRQPFGRTIEGVLYRVVYGQADLDGLDPDLAELVEWALRKDPAERPTAQQLLYALVHRADSPAPAAQAAPTQRFNPPPGHHPLAAAPAQPARHPTPADHPTPAAPRPRMGRRGIALWTVLSVLALVCFCCGGGFGGFVYFGYRSDVDDVVTALDSYLLSVKHRKFSAAYDRLCPELKSETTRDEFAKLLGAGPRVLRYTIDEDSIPFRTDGHYKVRADVRRSDGRTHAETYHVDDISTTNTTDYVICPSEW